MNETLTHDPMLGWVPAIPLPFYRRPWWALFKERFGCGVCRKLFDDEHAYRTHYVLTHVESERKP